LRSRRCGPGLHPLVASATYRSSARPASGAGQLSGPQEIAINQHSGRVYVADYFNNRVQEFTPSGAFVRQFGSAQLFGPGGIAVG
jgi:DNA-binding beta-propeller fold protein YncE